MRFSAEHPAVQNVVYTDAEQATLPPVYDSATPNVPLMKHKALKLRELLKHDGERPAYSSDVLLQE